MQELFAVGDSITLGHWDPSGGWVARIRALSDQVVISSRRAHYSLVYNLGVSSDTSSLTLARYRSEVTARHKAGLQRFTVVSAGLNDSKFNLTDGTCAVDPLMFASNLQQLIKLSVAPMDALGAKGVVVVLGLVPIEEKLTRPIPWLSTMEYRLDLIDQYNRIAIDVTRQMGASFVNLTEAFGASRDQLRHSWDGVHLNSDGHALIARLVLTELMSLGWRSNE